MDSWTFARRLQLRGQPRYYTAFQFKSLAGTLRVAGMIPVTAERSTLKSPTEADPISLASPAPSSLTSLPLQVVVESLGILRQDHKKTILSLATIWSYRALFDPNKTY